LSFTAIENIPIQVNLLTQANDTGWSISGNIATHQVCNSGYIRLRNPILSGVTYQVSYAVLSINSGYVQLFAGTTGGVQRTAPGLYVENIVSNGTELSFFSNGNCQIQSLNIRNTVVDTSNTQKYTPVYSFDEKKWIEFRTIAPDYGFSIYIDMVTMYQGQLWLHQNGSPNRNNFYGTQYQTIFQYVENSHPEQLKSYNSIAMQSNELLVTATDGIVTSLGQVSDLIEADFIKQILNDGVTSVNVESVEGIYSASFLKDKTSAGGLINGNTLKGNYITITLTTINGNIALKLFSIAVNASQDKIGTR
jgi:hypothetical protein